MRDTLICTVGTSLKGNITHGRNSELRRNLEKQNAQGLAVELLNIPAAERICGAEINSILSIISKGYIAARSHLYFLVSDTPDGKFTGEILKQYYSSGRNPNRFEEVDVSIVEGLSDVDVFQFRNVGLRNLVRCIGRVVRKRGSERTLINATGGYKAQISFAGMIGQALEIPVCYLFERFSEVILLPPQPISLDLNFWLEHNGLFFDLEEGEIFKNKLDLADERFATLIDCVEEDGKFLYALSPTGQLFHESFRHRFVRQRSGLLPQPTDIPVEKRKIKYEDQNSGKHKGLDDYLKKVSKVLYVTEISTHYYNRDLSRRNIFRKASKASPNQLEGWYSNDGALTKFFVRTTAITPLQLQTCIADLNYRFA